MLPFDERPGNAMRRGRGAFADGGNAMVSPEVVDRATFLPIGQYEDGSLTLAWPGAIKEPYDAFMRGWNALAHGQQPNVMDTLTVAATPITGNLVGKALGAIPEGARGVGASNPPKAGIRAFHGSPHDFDRFDLSKIGGGEGAQAYGHGLYFAESEQVARNYRHALSGNWASNPDLDPHAMAAFKESDGTPAGAVSYALKMAKDRDWAPADAEQWRNAARLIEEGAQKSPGHTYEVRINAEPEQFLDWDKPLAEQGDAVRTALRSILPEGSASFPDAMTGKAAYHDIRLTPGRSGLMMDASLALRDAGVPGIRYLDAGSRSAGEGSHNYVVFNDALIDILRKYGLLGTAGLGSMLLGGEDASASEPDPSTQDILQQYGLLTDDRPQELLPQQTIPHGNVDPFDRYNDPWGEVPEIINNPFGDPPDPPLPRMRRPLPFRLGPPTG